MTFVKKPKTSASSTVKQITSTASVRQHVKIDPVLQRQQVIQRQLQRFTARPLAAQKQALQPVMTAAKLQHEETEQFHQRQSTLQQKSAELTSQLPPQAIEQALQRQQSQANPVPLPRKPQTTGEWVTVMRQQAEQAEGRTMNSLDAMNFTTLQWQIAQTIVQRFRQDKQPSAARYAEYGEHLATLQRHPISGQVARVVMSMVPQDERPALQRAVDEVIQRETLQRVQDEQALELHSLQRQLAELQHEASQPVFERIQARRGSGAPLPEAVRRHLEQGLNHDLSAVRIHDDAEADLLAKGVSAIAFTTGTDIYFQSGKFNPNTQTGLELLAHEVTHTVQQAKGNVPKGIDGDAGLEAEARSVGRTLANKAFKSGPLGAKVLPKLTARTSKSVVQRAAASQPPSWKVTANPALLEQMLQKDMPGFLRQMLGRTLLDQNHYSAQNRNKSQAIPALGKIFLDSLDHVPVSAASKQKVLHAAIYQPDYQDWIRLEIAKATVALKRTDVAKGQAVIKTLEAKIAKAASIDQVGDFGRAIGSRLWDTVVGIYKLAKFVAWDNSTIRMLVDFKGYTKMWCEIGATVDALAQNPGLIWEAMTKDTKDVWNKGEYGKALGYITFDVASVATAVPGAIRAAATVPGRMRVVLSIAKDMKGNLVAKTTEVGDQIITGMQMTANDVVGRPNLATANVGGTARPRTSATTPTPGMAAHNTGPINPITGTPATATAGRTATNTAALTDPKTLKGLPKQLNLAERCSNWSDIAKVVGKKAGPSNLPPKYRYAKIPLKGGGFEQYAYLPDARDIANAVPKLKADAKGNWQPAGLEWTKKKDGTYTISRDYRLAQSSEYNASNPPPAGFEGQGAVNNHHMTPDEIMRGSPIFQEMFARGLISPDRASNMINLAVDAKTLAELRNAGFTMSDITHYTSHPKYTAFVRATLERQISDWQLARKLPNDLSKASAKQLMQFTDSFDRYLRRHFFQDADQLKHLLRTNGSLGSAPSPQQESELA